MNPFFSPPLHFTKVFMDLSTQNVPPGFTRVMPRRPAPARSAGSVHPRKESARWREARQQVSLELRAPERIGTSTIELCSMMFYWFSIYFLVMFYWFSTYFLLMFYWFFYCFFLLMFLLMVHLALEYENRFSVDTSQIEVIIVVTRDRLGSHIFSIVWLLLYFLLIFDWLPIDCLSGWWFQAPWKILVRLDHHPNYWGK